MLGLDAVRVTVNGHRVSARIKGRNGVLVQLGGQARGRLTVRVVSQLHGGGRRITVRHLRTCTRALVDLAL